MSKDVKETFLLKIVVAENRELEITSPTGQVDSGIAFDVGQMLLNLARNTSVVLPKKQNSPGVPVETNKNIEA